MHLYIYMMCRVNGIGFQSIMLFIDLFISYLWMHSRAQEQLRRINSGFLLITLELY